VNASGPTMEQQAYGRSMAQLQFVMPHAFCLQMTGLAWQGWGLQMGVVRPMQMTTQMQQSLQGLGRTVQPLRP
jgi:hypothetical protein